MTKILNAGVIGAGVFGGYHAAKYAELEGVTLKGVYDPSTERSEALASRLGVRAFADLATLLADVDVVTIATPAFSHADLVRACLLAGRHVYVEKPLVTDLAEGDAIEALARQSGLVVAVGHQERAIFGAMGLLGIAETPLWLESVRHGTPSPRNLDVSVVLDLMIHDLDLALSLDGSGVLAVEAEADARGENGLDAVHAEATFNSGFTARFDSSRVAAERKRTMRLVYPSGEIVIDFLARTFTNSTPHALDPGFADSVEGRDPLGASVRAFLQAVRVPGDRPLAGVSAALEAVDLALAVEMACEG